MKLHMRASTSRLFLCVGLIGGTFFDANVASASSISNISTETVAQSDVDSNEDLNLRNDLDGNLSPGADMKAGTDSSDDGMDENMSSNAMEANEAMSGLSDVQMDDEAYDSSSKHASLGDSGHSSRETTGATGAGIILPISTPWSY